MNPVDFLLLLVPLSAIAIRVFRKPLERSLARDGYYPFLVTILVLFVIAGVIGLIVELSGQPDVSPQIILFVP